MHKVLFSCYIYNYIAFYAKSIHNSLRNVNDLTNRKVNILLRVEILFQSQHFELSLYPFLTLCNGRLLALFESSSDLWETSLD